MWHQEHQQRQDAVPGGERDMVSGLTRRQLLQRGMLFGGSLLGVSIMGSAMTACHDPTVANVHATIDLRNEVGMLNYAYALMQLSLDFYARINATGSYPNITVDENNAYAAAVAATTAAKTELLTNRIPSGRISDALRFNIGNIVDYSSRASVLANMKIIEETSAHALQTLSGMITTSASQTYIDTLMTQAQGRATTVNGWLGTTFTPGTIDLVAGMTTLASYFVTTISVTHA